MSSLKIRAFYQAKASDPERKYDDNIPTCLVCGKRVAVTYLKDDGRREFKHIVIQRNRTGKKYTKATYCVMEKK